METTTKLNPVNILGGSFVGSLLTALCFGVLTIQTSRYYHTFPDDRRPVKLVVGLLWTFEAFQLACCTQSLYRLSVTNYYNPVALERGTWEFSMFQINMVCSSVIVQTFFAYRLYSLSANLYVGVFVQVLVLIQFGFGAATSVRVNVILDFPGIVRECTWLIVTWLAIQAAADIVIAACMCLLLWHRRTGSRKTDSMINRMILYTISTGSVTSVLSCFVLMTFVKYGFHLSELTISMPLGGFYTVTMLANLHSRKTLQARLDTPTPLELISSSIKNIIGGTIKVKRGPMPLG
ncbi:hypothetical protein BS47DRAFT_1347152 [Hydnum rufescens UP504]|uniref:DUF6534 domain-containing protein n=1 Tax=Hydnum rufescens UP504 TaxID=1448309 RepID=A0A9P6AUJ8_9AGAM|nr:hypothetical protein BS47DRAFT_1347152 [Hydnum rufescens UP504]